MGKYIIREGSRPFWHVIVAALCFTLTVILIYFSVTDFSLQNVRDSADFLYGAILTFTNGLLFSIRKDVLFDLEGQRYKIQYCVGPIHVGGWQSLPTIEYVSVFKQLLTSGDHIFETNLWHSKNKHFKVYGHVEKEMALAMGHELARILSVDLLDATTPNDYKWLDLGGS